jgi:hypothetical protein
VAAQVHRHDPVAKRTKAAGELVLVAAGTPAAVQQQHPRTAATMVEHLQRHHARADHEFLHRNDLTCLAAALV